MSKYAYSLIEVLFVVLIIAVIASIALPRVSLPFSRKMKVKTAAHCLAVDLRYTRRLAIVNRQNYRLSISAAAKTYAIYDVSGTQVGATKYIGSDITINGNKNFIFELLGNTATSSSRNVSLSSLSSQATITVTAATGMVQVSGP